MANRNGGAVHQLNARNMTELDRILHSHKHRYREGHRIRKHYAELQGQYPALVPAVSDLTQNNGSTNTWINFHGTIPIYYVGNQYNIPIQIWLRENYPLSPPMCYVRPTHDMLLKPRHRHMDMAGLIYVPYLHEWDPSRSSLIDLASCLSVVFSEDPPCYARGPTQPPPAQVQTQRPQSARPVVKQQSSNSVRAEQKSQQERQQLIALLTSNIQTKLAESKSSVEDLLKKQQQLSQSEQRIQQHLNYLTGEKQQLEASMDLIEQKDAELSKWLEENEGKEFDPDEVVEPGDTMSRQLLDAMANDAAIEDTMYKLERAFKLGTINLQDFMKETRKLATQQFFHKALVKKIMDQQKK